MKVKWYQVYRPNGELIAAFKYKDDADVFEAFQCMGLGEVEECEKEVKTP